MSRRERWGSNVPAITPTTTIELAFDEIKKHAIITYAIDQHRQFSGSGGNIMIRIASLFICHDLANVGGSVDARKQCHDEQVIIIRTSRRGTGTIP